MQNLPAAVWSHHIVKQRTLLTMAGKTDWKVLWMYDCYHSEADGLLLHMYSEIGIYVKNKDCIAGTWLTKQEKN